MEAKKSIDYLLYSPEVNPDDLIDVMPYGSPPNIDYNMPMFEGSEEPNPVLRQDIATGGRVGFAAGGFAKMIQFLLKNKNRINELFSIMPEQITMESLERLAKEAPERLKNMYDKLFSHINLKKGEAPKTDLEKVRTQKKKTDDIEKELAKSKQIPVKDITDPSTLTTEELIEFRKTNRAGKGQFTNAEAIIARLENTIKEVKPDDEDYEYVSQTFPNFIKELKEKPELANNENVWNNLMSDLPSDQRFVKYDDGTVDFQTKRPSHTFKLRKDLDTDRRGVAPEATSEEKLYDEYIYYRDELGNFEGSFDDFIVARRKAGSLLAEETPLSTKAVKRKQNAEGGFITDRLEFSKGSDALKANYPELYQQYQNLYNKFKDVKGVNLSVQLVKGKPYINILTPSKYHELRGTSKTSFSPESLKDLSEVEKTATQISSNISSAVAKTEKKRLQKFKKVSKEMYKKGRYGTREQIVKEVNQVIEEIADGKRPLYDAVKLKQGTLIDTNYKKPRLYTEWNTRDNKPYVLSKKNYRTYVNKISPHMKRISNIVAKTINPEGVEAYKSATIDTIDNVMQQFPSQTRFDIPTNVGEHMMQSIDRHIDAAGGSNSKQSKFKKISGDNMTNFVFKEKSTGKKFSADIVNENPTDKRWKKYVDVYDEVKDVNYNTPVLDKTTGQKINAAEAYRKLTGKSRSVPVEFDHYDDLGVLGDPIDNVGLSTRKANVAATIKGISKKDLESKFGRIKDIDLKGNKDRIAKFLERSLVQQATDPDFKFETPSEALERPAIRPDPQINPETGKLKKVIPGKGYYELGKKLETKIPANEILQDVIKGKQVSSTPFTNMARVALPTLPAIFGPTGVAGLTYALRPEGGYDFSRPEDRLTFELEAALAPATVKGTSKAASYLASGNQPLRRGLERLINLGMRAPTALKFARALSPIGLLSLAGEAGYFTYQKAKETQAAIDAMTPHQRELYESQMQGEALGTELGFATGGRVGFETGGPGDKKKTTPSLDDPIVKVDPNAPTDPSRRDFMEKGAGIAGLGAAIGTGLIKFGPEIVKGVKNLGAEVPQIIKELYAMILKKGLNAETRGGRDFIMGDPPVKSKRLGNFELHEGPEGITITRTIDNGDYGYKQEAFQIRQDENGKLFYEEATVRPDYEGKLKDIESGVDLDTYQEIGTFLSKVSKDDKYYGIAKKDIQKIIDEIEASKTQLD